MLYDKRETLSISGVGGERFEQEKADDNRVTIARANCAPEALAFQAERREGDKPYNVPQRFSVGYALSPGRPGYESIASGRRATVAVDFGTSSVRAYACVPDCGGLIPIELGGGEECEPQFVTSRSATEDEALGDIFRKHFYAPGRYKGSTDETLFAVFRRSASGAVPSRPFLDGVIYQFGKNADKAGGQSWREELYYSDLKWNGDKNSLFVVFMRQLASHITMWLYHKYHVTEFTWRYAFPGTPDERHQTKKRTVKENWAKVVERLNEESGLRHAEDGAEKLLFENQAASLYFLCDPQERTGNSVLNAGIGYLVADIGGGNTDIALWQRQDANRGSPVTLIPNLHLQSRTRNVHGLYLSHGEAFS